MTGAADFFRARFAALGRAGRAAAQQKYMKSALRFHGVDAAQLRAACRDYCAGRKAMTRAKLLADVNQLYTTDFFDLHSAACVLLERKRALLEPRDAALLIDLVRRSACWAHVDLLSANVLGHLVAAHPALLKKLPAWARDDSFWVRRAALLAQLGELKRGRGDFALFTALAVPLLGEKEFFIRKAIGWVLREVSKSRPALVEGFLREHGANASGLTRREASKYLPATKSRSA